MGSSGGPAAGGETVTMIKGARERSENHTGYGYDTVNITQCDLKRTIQLSDTAKKYIITPMETVEPSAPTTPSSRPSSPSTPSTRGGVVDYFNSIVDTGERKQMFGFTARHVKSATVITASADSCSPGKRKIELDGWYVDLNVEFNCDLNKTPKVPTERAPSGGCRDKVTMRREGTGKLGYPLIETMKMYGENGQVMVTQTKEVVELSRATLDAALFDIPAGYTQATIRLSFTERRRCLQSWLKWVKDRRIAPGQFRRRCLRLRRVQLQLNDLVQCWLGWCSSITRLVVQCHWIHYANV